MKITKELVYKTLNEMLMGYDDGFSDVDANDIAQELGCSVKAVNSCIGHLYEEGLVEPWDTGTGYTCYFTKEHPAEEVIGSNFEYDAE